MSEQSGGDPITREQVERLLVEVQSTTGLATAQVALGILGNGWLSVCPPYVAEFFDVRVTLPEAFRAALTRWRDELAAAEPVRRVARRDADHGWYVLTPHHTNARGQAADFVDGVTAIAWGYEIEGGPGPVAHHAASERVVERLRAMTPADGLAALVEAGIVTPDGELTDAYRARPEPAEDSPERLRERREALGLSMFDAADLAKISIDDVEALEGMCRRWPDCDRCGEMRPAYAAALSAEEERRATVAAECCAECGYLFGALTGDDGPGDAPVVRSTGKPDMCTNCAPERPAPRFKVGDRVRMTRSDDDKGFVVTRVHWLGDGWACENARGGGVMERMLMAVPASPPAPEVVDVPQPAAPVVKRCDTVTASWTPGKGHLTVRTMVRDMDVPIALLRAMLEAIDAQQGGAS